MHSLVTILLRSRTNAALMVLALSLLALYIPIFSYFCSAAIAVVALSKGMTDGVILLLLSTLVVILFALSVGESQSVVLLVTSTNGVSAMLLVVALVLRQTSSMSLSLLAASGLSALMLLGVFVVMADAPDWWQLKVNAISAPLLENMQQHPAELEQRTQQVDHIAAYIGYFGAGILAYLFICLFIARWWQSLVYNPGGFREEFRQIRNLKAVAISTLVLAILTMLNMSDGVTELARNLLLIIAPLYLVQGLSVVHAVVAIKKLHFAWLGVIYLMMLFMLPVVVMLGYFDSWVDIRRRLSGESASS